MGEKDICEVCNAEEAPVSCPECYKVFYCSTSHREEDWEEHKDTCKPTVIEVKDPERGRYLVPGHNVKAGELLFKEEPIALGPRASYRPVCLGCHKGLPDYFTRCPKCLWPLCSLSCSSSELHVGECPLLANDNAEIGQPAAISQTSRYDSILVIRCLLLRNTNPKAWQRLLSMASHAVRLEMEKEPYHMAAITYIKDILKANFEPKFIHHARGAILANCFEWETPTRVSIRGVYPKLGRFNHSCYPNVTISSDSEGVLYARAAIDVNAGSPLYITYTGITEPIWERHAYTNAIHYFTCDCQRCSDPTELGLHYSSPQCEKCKEQYLEPKTWLLNTIWECPSCHNEVPDPMVKMEYNQWLTRFDCNGTFITMHPTGVQNILEKIEHVFHDTHHIWVMAAHVAIRTLQDNNSRESLIIRNKLWERLLKIYEVLEPGMTPRRGSTLYELGVCQALLTSVEMSEGRLTDHFYNVYMKKALGLLHEAIDILKLEPLTSHDRVWYNKAVEKAEAITLELKSFNSKDRNISSLVESENQNPLVILPEEDMTKEDSQGICGTCQGPASLKCTACGKVYYCSKEHQKKHWKVHKKECCPVIEQKDQQQGRYLVASRDIPAGQAILKEKPMVLGPPSTTTAMCLGCLNPITDPDFPRCPKCSWPLCSPVCADSPLHTSECAFLSTDSTKKGPPHNLEETPRYDVILVLRCLALREKKPDDWKVIESMVNYEEKYKKEQEPYHMATVKYISEILSGVCDADLVHKVRGAIITNAINTKGPKGQSFRGMYPKIYLLNHSCHPNVTLRSDIYGFLYINAAVDIKKGDPLLFSYISPSLPLWQRQEELQRNYNFTCTCDRCTDPTELSTHFSSPKCPKCQDGFLEPSQNFKDPWKCTKCGTTKPLKDLIEKADKFMEDIEANSTTVKDAVMLLDNINKDYHPKHYVWLTAAHAILRNLASANEIEALLIKRDLWESILQLFFKLDPGTTRRRGVSLYHFACAEFAVFKAKQSLRQISPREYLAALTNVLYRLDSAKEIIALEAEDSFERRWLKLVKEEREKINKIKEELEES